MAGKERNFDAILHRLVAELYVRLSIVDNCIKSLEKLHMESARRKQGAKPRH